MSAVQSIKNQYRGINAHLHSIWQTKANWNRFHHVHIAHLMVNLRTHLDRYGHTAHLERSLQNDNSEKGLNAIVIYNQVAEPTIVARIELISPTMLNSWHYVAARRRCLEQGIVSVDLHYVHQSAPTFKHLPDYTIGKANSHAYHIVTIDPRPSMDVGLAYIYSFNVDDEIPIAKIPLSGGLMVKFDFGAVYRRTFEQGSFGKHIDYSLFPMKFNRYNSADQTRIARRMLAVLKVRQAGLSLEHSPCPTENISLDDALAQIADLTADS